MPCDKHTHEPWPKSGAHRFTIKSCETHCDWCTSKKMSANNLRAHARRHINNPQEKGLHQIVIVASKPGRSRLTTTLGPDHASHAESVVSEEPDSTTEDTEPHRFSLTYKAVRDENERLIVSIREASDECLMLRYKNSLLERILEEKGIDVMAELRAKARGSWEPQSRSPQFTQYAFESSDITGLNNAGDRPTIFPLS